MKILRVRVEVKRELKYNYNVVDVEFIPTEGGDFVKELNEVKKNCEYVATQIDDNVEPSTMASETNVETKVTEEKVTETKKTTGKNTKTKSAETKVADTKKQVEEEKKAEEPAPSVKEDVKKKEVTEQEAHLAQETSAASEKKTTTTRKPKVEGYDRENDHHKRILSSEFLDKTYPTWRLKDEENTALRNKIVDITKELIGTPFLIAPNTIVQEFIETFKEKFDGPL